MSTDPANLHLLSRSKAPHGPSSTIPMPALRWKMRILLPAVILLTAGGLLAYTARDALWSAVPVRVVPVVVKTVNDPAGGGGVVVQAPGWVEPEPFAMAVSALTDGIVEEVLVLEGEPVSKGQVVARLVPDDARLALARAEAEVGQRSADLATAGAALKAAQRDWDNPVERTRAVDVSEAMLAEARAELAQLEAVIAVEIARAEQFKDELMRQEEALASNAASVFEVAQTRLKLKTQEASIQATRARQPMLQAQVARLAAELKAARENLRLRIAETRALEEARAAVERSKAALAQAEVARDEAGLRLERVQVRSPVDGVIMARLVEPGDKMMLAMDSARSAQAVRLYDPKRLQVRVDVPLADAARVSVGQPALITVDVLPDRAFRGIVSRSVHEADIQKNTQQFKVSIEDPAAELKPEMLARVKFLAPASAAGSASSGQRTFAPERLIQADASGRGRVWIVDPTGSAAITREVQLGHVRSDGWVEIVEGLRPGDRLIAADSASLREGQKIAIAGEAGDDHANH